MKATFLQGTFSRLSDSVKKNTDPNDWEKILANYDRWQRRKKQNRFERFNVISVKKLGFASIDDLAQAVMDRLSGEYYSHRIHSDFARRGRDIWESQGITLPEIMRLPPDKMHRLIEGVLMEIYSPNELGVNV